MIQTDKRPEQTRECTFVYRNDALDKCPMGLTNFFAVAYFTDKSSCFYSQIFAKNRAQAYKIALEFFADCFEYIYDISIQEA